MGIRKLLATTFFAVLVTSTPGFAQQAQSPEQQVQKLESKILELRLESQALDLQRQMRDLEDHRARNQTVVALQKYYDKAIEDSRQYFNDNTIVEAFAQAKEKGLSILPEELSALSIHYNIFRLEYRLGAFSIISSSVHNLDHSIELRKLADSWLYDFEQVFAGIDIGVAHAAENLNRWRAEYDQRKLLSGLTDDEWLELTVCKTLKIGCEQIGKKLESKIKTFREWQPQN